eukprot:1936610-Pyramimonas_sp.AAC.1
MSQRHGSSHRSSTNQWRNVNIPECRQCQTRGGAQPGWGLAGGALAGKFLRRGSMLGRCEDALGYIAS